MSAIAHKDSIKLISKKKGSHKEESIVDLLPPIENKSSEDEIAWEIKALPDNWIPNTTPSKKIEKYIKTKEETHNKCIEEMRHKMTIINKAQGSSISTESECLKNHLNTTSNEINKTLRELNFTATDEILNKVGKEIEEIVTESNDKIAHFYITLDQIEKKRSEEFKQVLRATYDKLHEISFKLPYELQEFFELEILYINQITLNNYRCYEELNLQLKLKLENDKRLWINKYEQIKSYEEFEKAMIQDKLAKKKNINLFMGKPVTMESLQTFVDEIVATVMEIDIQLCIIKTGIEKTISKILLEEFDDMNYLWSEYSVQIHSGYSVGYLAPKILATFFEDRKEITAFTIEMMMKWEKLISTIEAELESTRAALTSALHIWDNHFIRSYEINDLFKLDFAILIGNNAIAERIEYNKIHTLIDKIRISSNEEELNGAMAEAKKCIDNFLQIFFKSSEKEINYLTKHEKYAQIDAEITTLEMKAYLNSHPLFNDVDPKLQRGRASRTNVHASNQSNIFYEISNHIKVMHNWMFGLNESISVAHSKAHESFKGFEDKYLRSLKNTIDNKLRIKKDLCGPHFQSTYENIYKVRLAEIKMHTDRLERHKAGVLNKITKLNDLISSAHFKYTEIQQKYTKDILFITKNLANVNRSAVLHHMLVQLEHSKNTNYQQLNNVYQETLDAIDVEVDYIKSTSLSYIQHIRLFHEGGMFSVNEVNYFKKELSKMTKVIKKQVKPIYKHFDNNFKQITRTFNMQDVNIIDKITKICYEYEFHETNALIVTTVQDTIKQETYKLKASYKIIEAAFLHLKSTALKRMGLLDYLTEFTENCNNVELAFRDLRKLIYQNRPFKLVMDLFKDDNGTECNLESNLIELTSNMKNNFNMVLFEDIPLGDDYMSTIINVLHTALTDIQTLGKEMYLNPKFITKDLFKSSLQEFMIDYLSTFLYYQLQCEEIWLVISIDYLILIQDVLDFICAYYKDSVHDYIEIKVKEFDTNCKQYNQDLKNIIKEVEEKFRNIHNKLKPLHGYIHNKHLLDELDAEMVALNIQVGEYQELLDKTYEDFRVKVNQNVEAFNQQLFEINKQLKQNLDSYIKFVVNDEQFSNQINDRIDYFNNILTGNMIDENSDIYLNIVSELNAKICKLKIGLRLKSEHLIKFSESLVQVLSNQTWYSKELLQDSVSNNSYASVNINVNELISKYRMKQERCLNLLDNSHDLVEVCSKWNEYWNNDKIKIFKLYAVKYDVAGGESLKEN